MSVPSTRERQKIPASQITRGQTPRDSHPYRKQLPLRGGYRSGVPGSSEDRNTNEETAELVGSESKTSPALSDRPIYYEVVPRWPPF